MKKELDAGWKGMSIADGYEKYAARNKLSKEDFQLMIYFPREDITDI